MKSYKVINVIGYILVVLGLIGLYWAIAPTEGSQTFTVPAGAQFYYYFEIPGTVSGHVSGEFEVTSTSSGSVNFYVFTAGQYRDYRNALGTVSLFSTTGSGGTFSVDLPSSGKHYLVIEHASGSAGISQEARIEFKMSGLTLLYLVGGAIALAIGIVLAVIGLRMKKGAAATQPQAAWTPSDVTVFESKTKPPP